MHITKKHISIALIIGMACIVFGTSLLFLFGVPEAHAVSYLTAYQYKTTPTPITAYTTFSGIPVYGIYVANFGATENGSVSAIAITPNSTTIDDTNVTLNFYDDDNCNGEIDAEDVDLGGSGTFSGDNTKTTFTFSAPTAATPGNSVCILALASGTGANGNTFNAIVSSLSDITCIDTDNSCGAYSYGGTPIASTPSPLTFTVSSTVPSITAANGSNNPSTVYIGPNSTNAIVQQLSFVNSSATTDVITSIQVTPTGNVAELTNYTLQIWREAPAGTQGVIDSYYDSSLLHPSGAWAGNVNGTTTLPITGGGFRIDGSSTRNFLFTITGNGTAAAGATHGQLVPISGITTASGVSITLASGQSDPLASATGTVDVSPPSITGVYSTASGEVDVTFSEPIDDSTFTYTEFELDSDASNNSANEYTANSYGNSTSVTYPAADTDSNDEYYHVSASGPSTTGTIYMHYTGTTLKDRSGNALATCNSCGTAYDAAPPALVGMPSVAVAGAVDTNGRNNFTFNFTENIFWDNTNQDGILDDGDTTSGESTTSTSSVGSFGQTVTSTYWVVKQLLNASGHGGPTPNVTQPIDACNTISVSGTALTVTFNTVAGCYFSGTAWPDVSSGATVLDGSHYYVYSTSGYNATAKRYPGGMSYIMSNAISGWDTTAPSTVTAGTATAAGTSIIPTWTAITDTHFGEYIIAYKTSAGASISNGTLWTSANDASLATATTASTTITGLVAGTTYYYVVYARDTAGNLSVASSEVSIEIPVPSGEYRETTPPGIPTGLNAAYKDGKVVLTWSDPSASDLALIEILRGKNEIPVSGDLYSSVNKGVQTYTDKDTELKAGDIVKYLLRAKDTNGNKSGNSETVIVTIPAASTQIVPETQNQPIQKPLTTEEKKLVNDEIALLEKSITMIDKVLGLYNVQIKKLNINKTRNKTKIAQIKSVMRRIEKNKAKQNIHLQELKKKLEVK
ncbi:MAG: hypothetical protein WCT53_05140 [Candidatus Gracilibacteria bacterium]